MVIFWWTSRSQSGSSNVLNDSLSLRAIGHFLAFEAKGIYSLRKCYIIRLNNLLIAYVLGSYLIV